VFNTYSVGVSGSELKLIQLITGSAEVSTINELDILEYILLSSTFINYELIALDPTIRLSIFFKGTFKVPELNIISPRQTSLSFTINL
jgi:hypothetical protein